MILPINTPPPPPPPPENLYGEMQHKVAQKNAKKSEWRDGGHTPTHVPYAQLKNAKKSEWSDGGHS